MTNNNGVNIEHAELTIPLLAIFQQVAQDGNFAALDWKKLEKIVRGAFDAGCATQADIDEVVGTPTVPKGFNPQRLGQIYKCLDGKMYGPPGRTPDVVATIKGGKI